MKTGSSGWNWKRDYPEALELSLMYIYSVEERAYSTESSMPVARMPRTILRLPPAQPQESSDSYTQSFAHFFGIG